MPAVNAFALAPSLHCVRGVVSLDSVWSARARPRRLTWYGDSSISPNMSVENFNGQSMGGQSMTGELLRVLVCRPSSAGWDVPEKAAAWRELGFRRDPDFATAQTQHEILCRLLSEGGAEVVSLPAAKSLTLDAVYAHDASLATDYGLVLMNPGKKSRVAEAQAHSDFCQQLGIPVFGEIRFPGTSESGDIVWLDSQTLLVGHGYRTNRSGIEQMRSLFAPKNVAVLSAPLPYGAGPSAC